MTCTSFLSLAELWGSANGLETLLTTAAAEKMRRSMWRSSHLQAFLCRCARPTLLLLLAACSGMSSALSVSAMGCCPYAAGVPPSLQQMLVSNV